MQVRRGKLAFGITRDELNAWKRKVSNGEIAFITHYWYDRRFPQYTTVTKVGCSSIEKLKKWGKKYNIRADWIHQGEYPHFDLIGKRQFEILQKEGLHIHIQKFNLTQNLKNN